jgi:hypothetical protein
MTAIWITHILSRLPDGQITCTPVQPFPQKYSGSLFTQLTSIVTPSRPTKRGVSRSSRTLVRDAVDARGALTRALVCGRQSRVVLTPRRWRQVGDDASHHAGDGGKKARSPGRARNKPLKPLCGECRVVPAEPVVTNARATYHTTRGYGCGRHPAFPAPSVSRAGLPGNTRAHRVARMRNCISASWRGAKRRSNPLLLSCFLMDCFAALAMTVDRCLKIQSGTN